MGCQVQQMMFIESIRMNGGHGKLTVSKRSRLVEDNGVDFCQNIQIVGSLHQNTFARSPTNATEEGQGNTDDQGTRTGNHQEHQGAIEPSGEMATKQSGNNSKSDGCKDHDRCIDAGKFRDESLALRLMLAGVFHQIDNLRNSAFTKTLRGAHLDDS